MNRSISLVATSILAFASTPRAQFYDLNLRNYTTSTTEYAAGSEVTVTYEIRNNGIARAPATEAELLIRYSILDALRLTRFPLPSMRANTTHIGSFTFRLPVDLPAWDPAGLGMVIDPDDLLNELNGGNNYAEVTGRTIAVSDIVIDHFTVDRSQWAPGETVAASVVIRNRGQTFAAADRYAIVLSTDDVITRDDLVLHVSPFYSTVGPLGTLARSASITFPQRMPVGPCWIGVIADVDNVLVESFEDNNTSSVAGTSSIVGTIEPIGSACGGLSLTASGVPTIGSTLQFTASLRSRVVGTVVHMIGLTATTPTPLDPIGATGCSLYIDPLTVRNASTVLGVAGSSLALPSRPELGGCVIHTQFAAVQPGANALGVTLSNGLKITIGG